MLYDSSVRLLCISSSTRFSTPTMIFSASMPSFSLMRAWSCETFMWPSTSSVSFRPLSSVAKICIVQRAQKWPEQ